jgi:biopolymer transport protein ExbD
VKKQRRRRRSPSRILLNLTSMIDVTFLLLFYFMVGAVLVRPEDKLSAALHTQSEGAARALDFQPQVIEVLASESGPRYKIGERLTGDRAELLAILEALPRSAGVIVRVRDSLPVGFAVAAVQCARDAGFEQVTYVPQE